MPRMRLFLLTTLALLATLLFALRHTTVSFAETPTQAPDQGQSNQAIKQVMQTLSITPSMDAMVQTTDPATNFGSTNDLQLSVEGQNRTNIFLYFPVDPAEGGPIPYQSIINSAVLKLSLNGGNQVATQVSVRPAIADWAGLADKALWESSITWNARPALTASVASAALNPGSDLTIDITGLYAGWLNDPGNNFNYGLQLNGRTEATAYNYSFSSREGANSPVIEVNYTPQPSKIVIPPVAGPVTVDNVCSPSEYPDAGYRFVDVNIAYNPVYIAHDDEYLYFCAENAVSDYPNRFYALYFDTDDGKEATAERDDLAFYTNPTNGKNDNAWGNSIDKFSPMPCLITPAPESCDGVNTLKLANWEAKSGTVTSPAPMEVAEYKIKLDLIGVNCQQRKLGLAYYHHWVTYDADDYGWPTDRTFNAPNSYIEASFDQLPSSLPTECAPVLPFQIHELYLPLVSGQ